MLPFPPRTAGARRRRAPQPTPQAGNIDILVGASESIEARRCDNQEEEEEEEEVISEHVETMRS